MWGALSRAFALADVSKSRPAFDGLVAIAMVLVSILAFQAIRHSSRQIELPIGCDDFGYLRQARLFQQHGFVGGLDTRLSDPVTDRLVRVFKASDMPVARWQELVAPHCHHYKPRVDRVVLQYPPGTGLLMSFFTEGRQARLAARLASLLMLAALLMALVRARTAFAVLSITFLALVCFTAVKEFSYSMSVSPSVWCAFALGYLLAVRLDLATLNTRLGWHAAAGLISGLAIDLRIPNGFMLAGFLACYALAWIRRPALRGFAAPAVFGMGCIVGALPLLAANSINAGSMFATTYGQTDAAPPALSWTQLEAGLRYFFLQHRSVAWTLALSLVPLIALSAVQLRERTTRGAMVLCAASVNLVTNLGYFILHDPRAPYYPVALAVFVAASCSFALSAASDHGFASPTSSAKPVWRRWAVAALSLTIVAWATHRLSTPIAPLFETADKQPRLDDRTVVWAHLSTGYFQYFQGRQASKLVFAPTSVQDHAMSVVAREGLVQIAISDSPDMATLIERLRVDGRAVRFGEAFGHAAFIVSPRPSR